MRRVVIHAWPRTLIVAPPAALVSAYGLLIVLVRDFFGDGLLVSVIGGAMALLGLAGVALAVVHGAVADGEGVLIRRFGLWQRIPWEHIDEVTVDRTGWVTHAPLLLLHDGQGIEVDPLRTRSQAVAQRRADLIAQAMP